MRRALGVHAKSIAPGFDNRNLSIRNEAGAPRSQRVDSTAAGVPSLAGHYDASANDQKLFNWEKGTATNEASPLENEQYVIASSTAQLRESPVTTKDSLESFEWASTTIAEEPSCAVDEPRSNPDLDRKKYSGQGSAEIVREAISSDPISPNEVDFTEPTTTLSLWAKVKSLVLRR